MAAAMVERFPLLAVGAASAVDRVERDDQAGRKVATAGGGDDDDGDDGPAVNEEFVEAYMPL